EQNLHQSLSTWSLVFAPSSVVNSRIMRPETLRPTKRVVLGIALGACLSSSQVAATGWSARSIIFLPTGYLTACRTFSLDSRSLRSILWQILDIPAQLIRVHEASRSYRGADEPLPELVNQVSPDLAAGVPVCRTCQIQRPEVLCRIFS